MRALRVTEGGGDGRLAIGVVAVKFSGELRSLALISNPVWSDRSGGTGVELWLVATDVADREVVSGGLEPPPQPANSAAAAKATSVAAPCDGRRP
ncbi:hypothetical protein AWC05_03135 [Mycobacterium florentinum]|uniref:Uncharacterized protein n=1 Tax=Mycobacterium florentinum TaxID=292462 RepID=A0A1X1TX60_MYCFL|nr:hypothetical protein AWC05_03135 [Mycobacterium florentinum]